MSAKLYNFGLSGSGINSDDSMPIAWPIAVWRCLIPESISPDINILEKMVLSLIEQKLVKQKSDLKTILCDYIGIEFELEQNVVAECLEKYIDKRNKELTLNVDAKNKLANMNGLITPDAIESEKYKSVFLIQDLVANTVVPCFNISKLPTEYQFLEDGCFISLRKLDDRVRQPSTASINNSICQWGKIEKKMSDGESCKVASFQIEESSNGKIDDTYAEFEFDDFPGDKEIDAEEENIQEINEQKDESFSQEQDEEYTTLESSLDKKPEYKKLFIYDDKPELYYALSYVRVNTSNPDELELVSPFGERYDEWFRKILKHLMKGDEDLKLELSMFRDDRLDGLKKTRAIKNDFNISLFDEFPLICNDAQKYGKLKKAITDLSVDLQRIQDGENEAKHFASDIRTALDVLFRITALSIKDFLNVNNSLDHNSCYVYSSDKQHNDQRFRTYKMKINKIVSSKCLDNEISRIYCSRGIFDNANRVLTWDNGIERASNTKDLLALIMIYAGEYPMSKCMKYVVEHQKNIIDAVKLTSLGNTAEHAGDGYETLSYTPEEATKFYANFEQIVRSTYSCIIEGE